MLAREIRRPDFLSFEERSWLEGDVKLGDKEQLGEKQ
jgi:hypothetical protein